MQAHDAEQSDCAATLRMLHYHDITGSTFPANYWRAAPHADFDTITLLFQRPGQGGLEVIPASLGPTKALLALLYLMELLLLKLLTNDPSMSNLKAIWQFLPHQRRTGCLSHTVNVSQP